MEIVVNLIVIALYSIFIIACAIAAVFCLLVAISAYVALESFYMLCKGVDKIVDALLECEGE